MPAESDTCDPAALGLAAHVCCKDDSAAQGLGLDEGLPGLEAPLAHELALLDPPIDAEACP